MQYFKENPDYNNTAYNTKFGVYSEGCGLNNVMMSWGHDDYMYLVSLPNFPKLCIVGEMDSKIQIVVSPILGGQGEQFNLAFSSSFHYPISLVLR